MMADEATLINVATYLHVSYFRGSTFLLRKLRLLRAIFRRLNNKLDGYSYIELALYFNGYIGNCF